MVTPDKIKKYLYLPDEVSCDDDMIQGFIDVATVYLENATDRFDLYDTDDKFTKQSDLFITLYAAELFNNRLLYNGEKTEPTYMLRSLVYQLQTY